MRPDEGQLSVEVAVLWHTYVCSDVNMSLSCCWMLVHYSWAKNQLYTSNWNPTLTAVAMLFQRRMIMLKKSEKEELKSERRGVTSDDVQLSRCVLFITTSPEITLIVSFRWLHTVWVFSWVLAMNIILISTIGGEIISRSDSLFWLTFCKCKQVTRRHASLRAIILRRAARRFYWREKSGTSANLKTNTKH